MWHVWNTEPYLRAAQILPTLILFAVMIHPHPAATRGKNVYLFVTKMTLSHVMSQCYNILFVVSRAPDNREMFQPSSASPMTRPGDGCKIDSTHGYLAQACTTSQAFFGETSQLILFYDLKVWGWMAERVGRGQMKVPTDFQVPRRASAQIGRDGPGAREERGEGGGN